jgi:hypothetical protein
MAQRRDACVLFFITGFGHTPSSAHEPSPSLSLLFICVTLTCSARFPFINSVLPTKHLFDHDSTMMSYSNSLLFREAGSLINRPVTFRTMASFWHPRTGTTVFLTSLSTTTELVVINLVPQHNPQPDPQFASYGDPSFSQSFLDQFAAVEAL